MTPAEQERAAYQAAKAKYVADKQMVPAYVVNLGMYGFPQTTPYSALPDYLKNNEDIQRWAASSVEVNPDVSANHFDNQYAEWAVKNNTPVFQEELAKFQRGEINTHDNEPIPNVKNWDSPFAPIFARAKGYFTGGEFKPGAATATQPLLASALNQWSQDAKPSGFETFLDNAMPGLLAGGLALATGLGPVVAGTLGGAASGQSVPGGDFGDVLKGAIVGGASGYAAGQLPWSGAEAGMSPVGTAGTAGATGTANTLADLGLGGASYAPGAAATSVASSIPTFGSAAFGSAAYPSITDAAIAGATGAGTGAAGAVVPGMFAPSMTEAALGAAGAGAVSSALYPTLTNMSIGSNPLADFLAQEGGSLTDYPGLSDFLAQEGGGDFTLEGLSAPGGTASWWNTAKDALGTTKAALGAGNTLSSLISGGTALWGANQTANAAKDAAAEAKRQFDIGQANAAPWLNAGKTALGSQLDLLGLPGGTGNSESSLAQLQKTPGYQFRLNQGRKNLEASSAARGGMGSGKSGVAMQKYGQDYATNEYNNRLNQLSSLSGSGQVQANTSANAGQQYGTEAGNAALTAATARQSGILGAGSALSDWLNPKPKTPTLADLLKGGNYGY